MVVPLLLGPDSGAVGYLFDTFEIWGATRYKHVPVLFNIYMNLHGLVIWGFGVSALYNDDPSALSLLSTRFQGGWRCSGDPDDC